MGNLFLSLIPLAIAAALQPPQVIALVILMQTPNGVPNGWSYFAGMTTFRLSLGLVSWVVISNVETGIEGSGGRFDIFVGAVLSVLGLLMLIYALRIIFTARDVDDATGSWLQKLESATPLQSALIGVAFLALDPKDWLVDISAIDLIAAADLSGPGSLLIYLIYVLMAQALILIPLVIAIVDIQKAQTGLNRLKVWLDRHEHTIMIVIALLLGSYFLLTGLNHLIG